MLGMSKQDVLAKLYSIHQRAQTRRQHEEQDDYYRCPYCSAELRLDYKTRELVCPRCASVVRVEIRVSEPEYRKFSSDAQTRVHYKVPVGGILLIPEQRELTYRKEWTVMLILDLVRRIVQYLGLPYDNVTESEVVHYIRKLVAELSKEPDKKLMLDELALVVVYIVYGLERKLLSGSIFDLAAKLSSAGLLGTYGRGTLFSLYLKAINILSLKPLACSVTRRVAEYVKELASKLMQYQCSCPDVIKKAVDLCMQVLALAEFRTDIRIALQHGTPQNVAAALLYLAYTRIANSQEPAAVFAYKVGVSAASLSKVVDRIGRKLEKVLDQALRANTTQVESRSA